MKNSKMKTGGMVNRNAKVSASKVAKGKVGGISKAPKTAKMQKGGNVLGENKWIGDLNQYLQKGVLQDIRNLYTPSKKTVAKKAVTSAKKAGTKKS
jgi:hypothetical protein